MERTKELLRTVESLQNVLLARATGEAADADHYRELRAAALAEPMISERLPSFVHTCRELGQFWSHIKARYQHYSERREHIWNDFRPLLSFLESGAVTPATSHAGSILSVVDAPHVQSAWHTAFQRKDSDPEGAITSARTLLKSVCKHILDEASVTYDDAWDLPRLYKTAAEHLNLAPQQHSELVFRQILGGCHTVVEGLGALRNKHGDAHGKGKSQIRPQPRHAALAVNLAGTVATFLVSTLEEKGLKQ